MTKTQSRKDYEHLFQLSKDAQLLVGTSSLLGWDQETYMPSAAAAIRAEQLELLAGLIHQKKTGRPFRNALAKLIDLETGEVTASGLSGEQKAALKEWQREFYRAQALPTSFVKTFAKLRAESLIVWQEARAQKDFSSFHPYLERIVDMNRQRAEYIGYEEHPYDALLDEFEPYMTTQEVAQIFKSLRKKVSSLLQRIQEAKQVNDALVTSRFAPKAQMKLGQELLEAIGYPKDKGRLDISTHPFSSSSHPTDCRITTRILSNNPMSNLLSILHESGHGFYEMGLPAEQYGSPLGESISLGIHESQSRFWETRIGLSKGFWKFFLPKMKQTFRQLEKATPAAFYKAIHKVEPSYIRVEADEVTYTLHVILRFEIECALIEGSLDVADIPEAWNDKMEELLGVYPRNDSEGCLQDVHWSIGCFGYFPTYALGNVYSSHLFSAFEAAHPDWEKRVSKGHFAFIRDWLGHAVHRHGKRYSGQELLKKVTGKKVSSNAYIKYLEEKYKEIYRLKD